MSKKIPWKSVAMLETHAAQDLKLVNEPYYSWEARLIEAAEFAGGLESDYLLEWKINECDQNTEPSQAHQMDILRCCNAHVELWFKNPESMWSTSLHGQHSRRDILITSSFSLSPFCWLSGAALVGWWFPLEIKMNKLKAISQQIQIFRHSWRD